MSYPVPPPPGHPIPAGNDDSSKPLDPPGSEYSGSQSQHGRAPLFKRPRSQNDSTPDSAALIPMNPRTSLSRANPHLNKGTGHIFYKTRLCVKFVGGNCLNGEKCTFAHGFEELHEPPPNWKEYVNANGKGPGVWDNDRMAIRGMKICRKFFFEKECPYGEKCNFLHEIPYNTEMARPLPMNVSAPSIETTGPMLEQRKDTGQTRLNKHLTCSDALLVNRKTGCLKTKVCTKWESTGECPFKEKCYYAHGQSELVTPGSHKMPGVTMDSSVLTKNIQVPLSSGGPNEAAAPTKVTEANKFLNWRPPKKIDGIYGDWLDGHSLPDNN